MILKFSFIKFILIYFLTFGAIDFLFGNSILNFLYEKNFIVNHDAQLKKIQENEKKYRIENDYFHHTLKKNIITSAQWGPFKYKVCTDEYGFRDICKNKTKYEKNIFLIGDSFTEGIGLNYEKTFGGIISENWKINVKNLAVASYSPIIYKNKIKYYLNLGLSAEHVIVFLDISDIDDENNYFHCKENKSICAKSDEKVESKLTEKKEEKKFPIFETTKRAVKLLKREIFPKNNIYEKDFIRSSWTYSENNEIIVEGINRSLKNMDELYNYLNERNIPLSIVIYPWPGQILHDKVNSKHVSIWKKFCEQRCENFINLFPLFFDEINQNSKEKVVELFYLKNDVHFNEDAHKKIFEKINTLKFY